MKTVFASMLALILIWSAACDESTQNDSGQSSSSLLVQDAETREDIVRYATIESNENIICISNREEYISFNAEQNCTLEPTYATDENGTMYYFKRDCLPAGYSKQGDQGYTVCSENETFTDTVTGYLIISVDGAECVSEHHRVFPHTFKGDMLYCGVALTYAMDENGSKYMFLSTCIGDGFVGLGYQGYPHCGQSCKLK